MVIVFHIGKTDSGDFKVKISYGIITIDGMPFIKHQLRLIYPHAHEIIICEGGDDTWEKLYGYRRSRDDTINVIKNFPDPENKITLVRKKWKDKNHMCHEYSRRITGDIIWHVDVDEFVDPGRIPYLVSLFEKYPEYDCMAPRQVVFWGDTETVIGAQNGGPGYLFEMPDIDRIYRFKKGLYIHHLPQRGYYDPESRTVISGKPFPDDLFTRKGIYNYHFSYVLPKTVATKIRYYNKRLPNCIKPGWYENIFMKFRENREEWIRTKFDVQPINPETGQHYLCRIKALDTALPPCLKNLEKDICKQIQADNTQ
jgi:hypothetical protein